MALLLLLRRIILVGWRVCRWSIIKVRRWRRRDSSNTTGPSLPSRNLISLGIHALLISKVVATLSLPSISLAGVGSGGSSHKESTACADCRTDARVA
jgi:hypothetical protein